jgi:hypothetical protein
MQRRSRIGRGTWGQRIGWGGVATVVVAVLFLVPSAASAKQSTTLKAPYTGAVYSGVGGTFTGCPATGSVSWSTTPNFNLTNGHAYVAGKSSQGVCKKVQASSQATAYTELETTSFTLSSGHHVLKATWNASYSIDLVATPGPSPQTAAAYLDLYTFAYVYDQTNGTVQYATYSTNLVYTEASGSLVSSFHGIALSDFVNATFASGHSYELVVLLEMNAQSTVSAGKSTASAEVNAATAGNKATLTSITGT